MSFILDALKKSDHKRKRGSVPDLMTVHDPMPQEPKHRSLRLYLLLAALLLNAGILAVWLSPWQSEKSQSEGESPAIKPVQEVVDIHLPVPAMSSAPAKTVSPQNRATEEEPLPEQAKTVPLPAKSPGNVVPQNQPIQAEADVQREVVGEMASTVGLEITPAEEEQALVITPSPTIPQPSSDIEVESEQRILNMDELPSSVRQGLPKMSISGHIYSNRPASRIVAINGQIIREGEAVTAGLNLEEITPTGVILSYKGYRFRLRAF